MGSSPGATFELTPRTLNGYETLRPTTVAAFDFDGTIADTFKQSPNGIGVNEAHREAIGSVFGADVLAAFEKQGGLRNRAPGELVRDLCAAVGSARIIQSARAYYDEHQQELDDAAIEPFDWESEQGLRGAIEVFVLSKLSILMEEIGQVSDDGEVWPPLTSGFAGFWEGLSANPGVTTVIISSGHDAFIKRVFDLHGLTPPDIMITDDTVRFLEEPIKKPDHRLFELGLDRVREMGKEPDEVVYFGDDVKKDGELAKNSGVAFFHFDAGGTDTSPDAFSDWSEVPWTPPEEQEDDESDA